MTVRGAVEDKARRYLVEGRLLVERVDAFEVRALCSGDTGMYELGHDGDAWWCSCPARGRCAHVAALALVTGGPAPSSSEDRE
jgi:uncharacterized Zn finger protein